MAPGAQQQQQQQQQQHASHLKSLASMRGLTPGAAAVPSMVWVLPLPVWPYAMMHTCRQRQVTAHLRGQPAAQPHHRPEQASAGRPAAL